MINWKEIDEDFEQDSKNYLVKLDSGGIANVYFDEYVDKYCIETFGSGHTVPIEDDIITHYVIL